MDNEIEIKKQKLLKYHLMFGTGNKEKDQLYINCGYKLIYRDRYKTVWCSNYVYSRNYKLTNREIKNLAITIRENDGLYFSLEGKIVSPNKEVIL